MAAVSLAAPLSALVDAFALPPGALVKQRIAKKLLAEQGAPTAADRRLIQDAIEDLTWHAVLKPGTVGVAAAPGADEIALLTLVLKPGAREAQARRVAELTHRAIPYPVLLAMQQPHGACSLSVATKRASQGDAARWVLAEPVHATHGFDTMQPTAAESAFLASLALHGLPRGDLAALYQGVADRITALAAAQFIGRYVLPADAAASQARRDALAECHRVTQELATARRSAAKARQLARRVQHNLQAQRLQQTLQDLQRRLDV